MSPKELVEFIRHAFNEPEAFIPLHAPYFGGNEKKYVLDTIESTFVSSVGAYVTRFEEMMAEITGSKMAIATVNGTTALHLALVGNEIGCNDYVITQALTFVATANAIKHAGAEPIFIDVAKENLGLCPIALENYLFENSYQDEKGICRHNIDNKKIAACLPMHTFGFVSDIEAIAQICKKYNLILIEDCAESLGSYKGNTHTGNFGSCGTFSFNGNKTVTCGGGGAIVTNDVELGKKLKHLSTTAKQPHPYEFYHDMVGYNYRMPNLNAALACAQLEQLSIFLKNKRELSIKYKDFFSNSEQITFIDETKGTTANFWLNTILFNNEKDRDYYLTYTNENKVMTRPIWHLMNELPMFKNCLTGNLSNSIYFAKHIVNLPSSFRVNE